MMHFSPQEYSGSNEGNNNNLYSFEDVNKGIPLDKKPFFCKTGLEDLSFGALKPSNKYLASPPCMALKHLTLNWFRFKILDSNVILLVLQLLFKLQGKVICLNKSIHINQLHFFIEYSGRGHLNTSEV